MQHLGVELPVRVSKQVKVEEEGGGGCVAGIITAAHAQLQRSHKESRVGQVNMEGSLQLAGPGGSIVRQLIDGQVQVELCH